MNIKQVKEQIEKTVKIYLQKNDVGEYIIPYRKQRPVFILGAPGIGKTAIMEQIAQELDIGMISYSMTHHTRQSAIGLPYITHKNFNGIDTKISEYSMSEIIGSVHKLIEETKKVEGILFLDEINCISETLTPTMLQFLQMKKFGMHSLPQGWIIVTAGNPAQFNRNAKEFDIATLDRLKVMNVEPDYDCWREYAIYSSIHSSIISYLDMRKTDFYNIETKSGKKSYVTARGWEDLSDTIYQYENNGYIIDENLIYQYLYNNDISRDFSIYYELYNKYKADYNTKDILLGKITKECEEKATVAHFDERMSVLGIMINDIQQRVSQYFAFKKMIEELRDIIIKIKSSKSKISESILNEIHDVERELNRRVISNSIDDNSRIMAKRLMIELNDIYKIATKTEDYEKIRNIFNHKVDELGEDKESILNGLNNLFIFIEKVWGVGKEIIVIVNDLTMNKNTARFISENGCERYFAYSEKVIIKDTKESLYNQVLETSLF